MIESNDHFFCILLPYSEQQKKNGQSREKVLDKKVKKTL